MTSEKENFNLNSGRRKHNYLIHPTSNTLDDLTEKAAKVRSFLERRQRNDAIKELISTSKNEFLSFNNFKSEILSSQQELLEKVSGFVEKKVDDYLIKNESCIKLNIDRSVDINKEIIKENLEKFLERIFSSIDCINSNIKDELELTIKKQKDCIENHFYELNESINNKENNIKNIIREEFRDRSEKENSLYLSQLRVIQKQYELIICDLRKRNTILDNEIGSKLIHQRELENKINLMNINIEELSNLINTKNEEILTLSSKLERAEEVNTNLLEDIKKLKIRNKGMIDIFRKQIELSKKRYILFGKGIYKLEFVFENMKCKRIETAFVVLRNYSHLKYSTKSVEHESSCDKAESITKFIVENSLYSLIEVEKKIREQEKEQSIINRLLSVIGRNNFHQLINFVSIFSKKRNDILKEAFFNLKFLS